VQVRDPVRLIHAHGGEPGLSRLGRGVYLDAQGDPVDDSATLARIDALVIPPAWRDVWISAEPNAHLQATGLDTKGRRQYRYHPAWRERRDVEKFADMLAFAARLPQLRSVVRGRLEGDGVTRERVLGLAIRLLDVGLFRVGWDRYARDNGHVGLMTLRRDQVRLEEFAARFDYVAKAGKRRRMTVRDAQVVRALGPLRRRRSGPEELLAFRASGDWHRLLAADVNNGLRSWAGGPFSAKEFRTWEATVLAAVALARADAEGRRGKRAIDRAVREVSTALGNTPTVARASYVDPRVIRSFEEGVVIELPGGLADPLRVETSADGLIVELPCSDAPRSELEQRVIDLLSLR
jgi:DNA topoisomerase-1